MTTMMILGVSVINKRLYSKNLNDLVTLTSDGDDRVMTEEEIAAMKAAYKKAYAVDYDERFFEA